MRVPMRNALLQFLASVQQGIAYTSSVSRPGGQNRVVELDSAESQIEHIVAASAECMRGTPHEGTWVFMHDALSQMTCKSTVQWMKDTGTSGKQPGIYALGLLP
ncbi:hypothetical protein H257_16227 [Aphanomyces astaci]|uniref:Uncharacterized protein n=1 Tax=Aphanomyces astaci TaxID=112090 RepID=W4FL87_APHAT|nr:hypothetical protein H257_16227 [Aphanomyces astaci]ETV67636.1 hypothetical protein H257_16227 [Aphanomyces astaci]|eukprot:XP_009842893.1 hypothetical protein H257_16227 [Aphanomyces astaci]